MLTEYTPEKNTSETYTAGELSIASQQYLKKYGLMQSSPTRNRQQSRHHRPSYPSKLAEPEDVFLDSSSKSYKYSTKYDYEDTENIRILPNIL